MAKDIKAASADDDTAAKRDDGDTARKRAAKKAGGNLFPEKKPAEDQIVLAYKADRIDGSPFVAQYRSQAPTGKDGAFYSNRSGSYSALEGTVDFWCDLPDA